MAKVLAVPGGPTSSICPAGILSSPNDAEDAEDAEDVGQLELKSPEKLQKKTAREGTNYIIKQTQGKEEYSSKTIREQRTESNYSTKESGQTIERKRPKG